MPTVGEVARVFISVGAKVNEFNAAADQVKQKTQEVAKEAEKSFKALGEGLEKAGRTAAIGFAALAGAGGLFVKAASDATETQNKFDVVFKGMTDSANRWAEEFASSVGRARTDVKAWMAELQDTFVPLGFARDKAYELSKSLVQLSVDVGSFNNVADAEVIRDFTSAIVGNHEAVRRYGIVITENSMKQAAMALGIKKNFDELTELEKVFIRYNIILNSSKDAQGDAVRTMDSFANQMKAFRADIRNTAEDFGNLLIPQAQQALKHVRELTKWFADLDSATKSLLLTIGEASAAFLGIIAGLGAIAGLIRNLTPLVTALSGPSGIAALASSFGPFLVGGSIVVGLTAIVALIIKIRDNARLAATEISKITQVEEASRVVRYWQEQVSLLEKQVELAKKIRFGDVKPSADWGGAITKYTAEHIDRLGDLAEKLGRAKAQLKEAQEKLAELSAAQDKASDSTTNLNINLGDLGGSLGSVKEKGKSVSEIIEEMNKKLKDAQGMEQALGKNFDLNQAKADIFREAIEELISAGLSPKDKRLADIVQRYQSLLPLIEMAQKKSRSVADVIKDLADKLDKAATQEAVLKDEIDFNSTKAGLLKQAMVDLIEIGLKPGNPVLDALIERYQWLRGEMDATAATIKVKQILQDMEESLARAAEKEKLLGDEFDLNAEKAKIFSTAIDNLITVGIKPGDPVLDAVMKRYQRLRNEMNAATAATKNAELVLSVTLEKSQEKIRKIVSGQMPVPAEGPAYLKMFDEAQVKEAVEGGIDYVKIASENLAKELKEEAESLDKTQRNLYEDQVERGKLTTQQQIDWVRKRLAAEKEGSDDWKRLRSEEFRLLKQQQAEIAEAKITEVIGDMPIDRPGLEAARKTLGALYDEAKKMGPIGEEAATKYTAALDKVNQKIKEVKTKEEKDAEEAQRREDDRLRKEYRRGLISTERYKKHLSDRMAALEAAGEKWSSEWQAYEEEMTQVVIAENEKAAQAVIDSLGDLEMVHVESAKRTLEAERAKYAAMGYLGEGAVKKIDDALKVLSKREQDWAKTMEQIDAEIATSYEARLDKIVEDGAKLLANARNEEEQQKILIKIAQDAAKVHEEAAKEQVAQAQEVAKTNVQAAIAMLQEWRGSYANMGLAGQLAVQVIDKALADLNQEVQATTDEMTAYVNSKTKDGLQVALDSLDKQKAEKEKTVKDQALVDAWYQEQVAEIVEEELARRIGAVERMNEEEVAQAQTTLNIIRGIVMAKVGAESKAAKDIENVQIKLNVRSKELAEERASFAGNWAEKVAAINQSELQTELARIEKERKAAVGQAKERIKDKTELASVLASIDIYYEKQKNDAIIADNERKINEQYGLERNLTELQKREILERLQAEFAALDVSTEAGRARAAALKNVITEISGTLASDTKTMASLVFGFFRSLNSALAETGSAIATFFEPVIDKIISGLDDAFGRIEDLAKRSGKTLDTFFREDLGGSIKNLFAKLIENFDLFRFAVEVGAEGLAKVAEGIVNIFTAPSRLRQQYPYGAYGEVNYPDLARMRQNYQNWEQNLQKLQQAQQAQATMTVGGGLLGGLFGFLIGGPIGALIGAGLGAGAGYAAGQAIYGKQIEELKKKLEDTFQKIAETLGTTISSMAGALGNAFSAKTYQEFLSNFATNLENVTKQALIKAFMAGEAMRPLLQKLSDFITVAVWDGVLSAAEKLKIAEMFQQIVGVAQPFWEALQQFNFAETVGAATDALEKFSEALRNVPTGFKIVATRWDVALPAYQEGGVVGQTGIALLHAGETVIPAGESGGIHVHLEGATIYGMDDFERKVEAAVSKATRRAGLGYRGLARAGAY